MAIESTYMVYNEWSPLSPSTEGASIQEAEGRGNVQVEGSKGGNGKGAVSREVALQSTGQDSACGKCRGLRK